MNVQAMDDDIGNKLDCDACPISNVHIHSSCINGLEAVHDQLLLQLNNHVPLEHNPEGSVLDHSMAKSAGFWVHRVIISGVSHHIELAITATNGISTKANATIRKTLPVALPVRVTTPAIINGVASSTREKPQPPSLCAVLDAPGISTTFRQKPMSIIYP
ncbi:hypothetical protein CR513_45203, partial [Mucuna pruriens]